MITGYPFLRIAQKHNLDYGDVLKAADYSRAFGYIPGSIQTLEFYHAFIHMPKEALKDIQIANKEFLWMKRGDLDYNHRHEVA